METKVVGGYKLGWLKLEYSDKNDRFNLIANILGTIFFYFLFQIIFSTIKSEKLIISKTHFME